MNTDRVIYLDMDGVLADFNKQVIKHAQILLGQPLEADLITQKYGTNELYRVIHSGGEQFFSEMPIMTDMRNLKDYIFNNFINIRILSSSNGIPPNTPRKIGKIKWLKSHGFNLPDDDILIVDRSSDKKKYARPNHILIDDYKKNIIEWDASGGIGILHTNARDTIRKLKSYV